MQTTLNIRHLALLVLAACATPFEPIPRSGDPSPPPPPVQPREDWGGTIAMWTCQGWDEDMFACTSGGFSLLRPGAPDQVISTGSFPVDDPAWSPDGEWIAFSGYGHCSGALPPECWPEIYRMNRLGGSLSRLGPPGLAGYTPAWSPDGTRIVFSSRNQVDDPPHLMIMGADGSDLRRLGGLSGWTPAWSPDGTRITYSGLDRDGYYALFVASSDGASPTQVTLPSQEISGIAADWFPAWSPDGARIAFTRHVVEYASGDGTCQVHSMNPDGSQIVKLTQDPYCASSPVWSPAGGLIVYEGKLPGTSERGLILIKEDGSDPRLLRDMGYDFSRVAWTSR